MNEYVKKITKEVLSIDSPTGYCQDVCEYVEKQAQSLGYQTKRSVKGNVLIYVPGTSEKTIGICGHVDTLGLMVRSIKADGTLAFTNIGGPIIPTLDGEYCRIITRDKKVYTGTILSNSPAAHVFKDASSVARECETMHVRIDEVVKNKEDVQALGMNHGDYIAIDPKTTITDSGFIKSRFLDDKLSVACFFGVLKELKEKKIVPSNNTIFIISTYEEVGHGSSHIPSEISELLAVDMGCVGSDLACSQYDVSICAKDSSGPYDYELTSKLINLAKDNQLNYAVDIYPFYGSDVSAALRGGNDIRGALIGPGVHASHGMERTHMQAVENTIALILAYLQA
ncbi:M42 family metallopeptidase [Tannockella kyphosi]|uniref:M42 family metallopeptidase n=1 Tax=Tannockella kyphosi TaxID=2899121 RepID=UPI002011758E|nr:M42 family metallopeptidase [Tannockella kyphosi]